MPTIRISDATRQALIEQKHGTDTFDDVIMRNCKKAKLLEKLPPNLKDMLMTREATPCQT